MRKLTLYNFLLNGLLKKILYLCLLFCCNYLCVSVHTSCTLLDAVLINILKRLHNTYLFLFHFFMWPLLARDCILHSFLFSIRKTLASYRLLPVLTLQHNAEHILVAVLLDGFSIHRAELLKHWKCNVAIMPQINFTKLKNIDKVLPFLLNCGILVMCAACCLLSRIHYSCNNTKCNLVTFM